MTTEVKSSADQATGCCCGGGKAASASTAQPKKVTAPAPAETPKAEPAASSESKGCCGG